MAAYTYELIDLGDDAVLGCKCCRFGHGTDLPIPKTVSIEEIAKQAHDFSHSIFASWTRLNAILKRFEEIIQKRWLKKNAKQRREILLKVWPDMAPTHRPDFAEFRKDIKKVSHSRVLHSAALLWPHINLEDLQHRSNLLHFLNSRGRNLPELFLHADLDAAHLGSGWDGLGAQDGQVMLFRHNSSPRTYGQLLEVPEDCLTHGSGLCMFRHALKPRATRFGIGMSFPPVKGLLALEIQAGKYQFLLSCAEKILHDIDPRQFFLAPNHSVPPVPECTTGEWVSLSSHMQQAPYRLPQKIDLEQLKLLVGARRSSAEDHLWMLREDPGYFIDSLRDEYEHNPHCGPSLYPKALPSVACDMLEHAFVTYLEWNHIYGLLKLMPPLETQLQNADFGRMRLPKREERMWAELLEVVQYAIYIPITRLKGGIPSSPRMRRCFEYDPLDDNGGGPWEFPVGGMNEAEYRVFMLFNNIVNPQGRQLHTLNRLVQEVQYMFDTDAEARQLVDPWIVSQFSDLAILSELKLRIEGLRPWYTAWSVAGVPTSTHVVNVIDNLDQTEALIENALSKAYMRDGFKALGDKSVHEAWEYPASKKRTEANVLQMQAAEARLDLLWEQLHSAGHKSSKICINKIIQDGGIKRTVYRTPNWIPPVVAQEKKAPLVEVDPNISHFSSTSSTAKPSFTPEAKTKVKTRGTAAPPTEHQHEPVSSFEEQPAQPRVKIPKRAYRVFSALLPEPNAGDHQRIEIAWDELLRAMDTIGLEPEKLYGSVWMFKPKAPELCMVEMSRSVQFHEPKEVRHGGKISAKMVRTFGRRLKHAYGWEGGMFDCE